jgi:hypothetical protein
MVVDLRQCAFKLMMTRQGTAVVLRLYTVVVLECCEAVAIVRRAWTHANPKPCGRARGVMVLAIKAACGHAPGEGCGVHS